MPAPAVDALAELRPGDLALARKAVTAKGKRWRAALVRGLELLAKHDARARERLEEALRRRGCGDVVAPSLRGTRVAPVYPMPKLAARRLRVLVTAGPLLGLALAGADCSSSGGGVTACCPIEPAPSCCMRYGGHGACGMTCDGMPVASDPGWRIENDALGCPAWINRSTTAKLCGAPWIDPDAGDVDDLSDGAHEATGDVVTDETSGCTLSGATCSAGCFAAHGQRVDTTRACVGAYEVIACVGAVDGHTGYACVVDATGTAWRVAPSMTPTGPGWTACSAAAQAIAVNDPTPSCP